MPSTSDSADRLTWVGLSAVGTATAVLSFQGLTGFAELAGVTAAVRLPVGSMRLAWLLPVALDAYALVATRVWLGSAAASSATRRAARRQAYAAVGLSVAFNAVHHTVAAVRAGSAATIPAGVALSVVLPVLLASVAHLAARVAADRSAAARPRPAKPSALAVPAAPVEAADDGETKARMRAHWLAEQAAGRELTGAELDRLFGTRDYGRRIVRELRNRRPGTEGK